MCITCVIRREPVLLLHLKGACIAHLEGSMYYSCVFLGEGDGQAEEEEEDMEIQGFAFKQLK